MLDLVVSDEGVHYLLFSNNIIGIIIGITIVVIILFLLGVNILAW